MILSVFTQIQQFLCTQRLVQREHQVRSRDFLLFAATLAILDGELRCIRIVLFASIAFRNIAFRIQREGERVFSHAIFSQIQTVIAECATSKYGANEIVLVTEIDVHSIHHNFKVGLRCGCISLVFNFKRKKHSIISAKRIRWYQDVVFPTYL